MTSARPLKDKPFGLYHNKFTNTWALAQGPVASGPTGTMWKFQYAIDVSKPVNECLGSFRSYMSRVEHALILACEENLRLRGETVTDLSIQDALRRIDDEATPNSDKVNKLALHLGRLGDGQYNIYVRGSSWPPKGTYVAD